MLEKFKILFIGDIVGRPGREVVKKFLFLDDNKKNYDFVIANVENASHGFGLTKKNHDELFSYGIDAMTSGNHIWDKREIYSYIQESETLLRPYNYHPSIPGRGYRIFKDKIVVISLLGRTFMPPIDCPFVALENILCELRENTNLDDKIIFVDFHAEATAEKQCFARFASELGVSAVLGTHTHVQTADETIIDKSCAYLSDVGFCGSKSGVIGMEYETSLKRLMFGVNERFDVKNASPYVLNACEIEFDQKTPINIKRVNFEYTIQEGQESED